MKFAEFSDIHGNVQFVNELPDQKDTILLIPGDIHEVKRFQQYKNIVQVLTNKFKEVVMVPGNHEYYKSNFHKTHRKLQELDNEFDNFHFLQNDFRIFTDGDEQVLIMGATLWTDYDGGNPLTKFQAQLGMNDYRCIRFGPDNEYWHHRVTPDDIHSLHWESRNFLFRAIDMKENLCENTKNENTKLIVMTHHAPSFQSVDPYYANDNLNGCYCSNLDYVVGLINADVWVHGHIHCNHDYMIGNTRVICNPRGYGSENFSENPSFNSSFKFEV